MVEMTHKQTHKHTGTQTAQESGTNTFSIPKNVYQILLNFQKSPNYWSNFQKSPNYWSNFVHMYIYTFQRLFVNIFMKLFILVFRPTIYILAYNSASKNTTQIPNTNSTIRSNYVNRIKKRTHFSYPALWLIILTSQLTEILLIKGPSY